MNPVSGANSAKLASQNFKALPGAEPLPVSEPLPGPFSGHSGRIPENKPSALETFWDSVVDKGKDIFDNGVFGKGKDIVDKVLGPDDSSKYGGHDYTWWRDVLQGSSHDGPSQPEKHDYLDAPWASAYGMSKETAYNEAMTNTEYRRAVKDMQAAGLNPAVIFGAGKGSTAGVPGYISSSSPGGGGGGGGFRRYGGSSSRSRNDYLFSSSAYSILSVLGGVAGAAITKSASGYWIGTSILQGAMNAASILSRSRWR